MIFIEMVGFTSLCIFLSTVISILAFPIMAIAAYFLFSGGTCWIAMGLAMSFILGVPLLLLNRAMAPPFVVEYGSLFDTIGFVCVIVGVIKLL